jgi:hypothetical protein
MLRYACLTVPAFMLVTTPAALALELDSLLPPGIPGFGTAPYVTVLSRLQRGYQAQGICWAGLTISPQIQAGTGYDSAPNGNIGATASLTFAPRLQVADKAIGLGAFASLQTISYPQNRPQGSASYTLALGEAALLPQNTITLAAARWRSQQTGFSLEPILTPAATSLTGTALRAGDDFATGVIVISPEFSYLRAASQGATNQSATETTAGAKLQIIPDGVLRITAYTRATHLSYTQTSQNAWDYTGLLGIADTAEGIWDFRFLAGLTARAPALGSSAIIPVVEAAADWMPDELSSLQFSAAHEIDDPERIDTSSYTMTQSELSVAHEYLRNIVLTASIAVTRAAFFQSPLTETITQTEAGIGWRLNSSLKLAADYNFNDRQANRLRAANEHELLFSLTWSP